MPFVSLRLQLAFVSSPVSFLAKLLRRRRVFPCVHIIRVPTSSSSSSSSPHLHTFFFSFSPQSSTHTFTHTKIRGHKEHYFDSRSLPGIASLPFSRFMSRLPFFSTHPCLSLKQCPCRCPCSSVLIFYSLLIFS